MEAGRSGTSGLEERVAFPIDGLATKWAHGHGPWSVEPPDGPLEGKLAEIELRSASTQCKPVFGREGEDLNRRGGECRGVWTRDDRYPGGRRPERLGKSSEVGDDRDPVGQPGHHARPPGADPVRVRLEEEIAGPQVGCHHARGQFPGPCHPTGQVRVGRSDLGCDTARTPGR